LKKDKALKEIVSKEGRRTWTLGHTKEKDGAEKHKRG